MLKIRHIPFLVGLLLCSPTYAETHLSINIGINTPIYPELVVVPGYPVYYAPRLEANYFFYDGMYWVYQDDNWYESDWYNGPWWYVDPDEVPLFVLRIPVRYYRQPPMYFYGWRAERPPHWGEHWGHDWDQRRSGWNRWRRDSAPPPAPLPTYQRQYSGDRYPRQVEQQETLHQRNYRYQPRDPVVQQHVQETRKSLAAPVRQQPERSMAPEDRSQRQQEMQRVSPSSQQQFGGDSKRAAPTNSLPDRPVAKDQPQTRQEQVSPVIRDNRPLATPRPQDIPHEQSFKPSPRSSEDVRKSMPVAQEQPQRLQPDQRDQQMQPQKDREDKLQKREKSPWKGQDEERGRGRNE